ncbi:3-hydroxyisobutyryl-CoA hydrolase [Schizosaccharomyces japonicus yFS275]|uniref:3-hydroxyisobutyryl-CoA hydrolase n=1 Tax=Schizosaccharomyces japonicus (strain yFS275 / FY16936) TaxID=402676 RepID=B6JX18_SCHJY|nr:3-hydroxyisobutyryl-CoA hydrolase [Schizosaccharomyces japonicus yFS275]EEB05919.1 3-hydroxyisobutyryl-CoA hydrolase [Schizosaccharomyces japonicus yFS275]
MSRARLTNKLFSTTVEHMDSAAPVLVESKGGMRCFILNRPAKLNAINRAITDFIHPRLIKYEKSDMTKLIVFRGVGRAFSSGGDVKAGAINIKKGRVDEVRSAFAEEYRMCHTIATCAKPVVTLMNGITMGGGAGIAMHTPFRIACQDTKFAMPETTIGYFTDVAASFFLSRLSHSFGRYLALTSSVVSGYDCVKFGIATHYVPKHMFDELLNRLAELNTSEVSVLLKSIQEFSVKPESYEYQSAYPESRISIINDAFSHETIPEIMKALEKNGSEFALQTLDVLHTRCPLSMLVTDALLHKARRWTITDAFKYDHIVSYHMLKQPDFVRGVTARLIEKSKNAPSWQHKSVQEVDPATVQSCFEPLPENIPCDYYSKDRPRTDLWDEKNIIRYN